jgi:hypothetical protein
MTNLEIADKLHQVADLLAIQEASPYRVRAYRLAGDTVRELDEPVARLLERGGVAALAQLPGFDRALAAAIAELTCSGHLALLDRLRGTPDPERLFRTVPGVGPRLARLLHDALHVDTLEALEAAAHDGRVQSIPGVGPRRAQAIHAALEHMLGRRRSDAPEPDVSVLLDVDREYRARGDRPILHTQRGDWHFTALYSHTHRAQRLGRDHDWVLLYFTDGTQPERQRTVVTETDGPLVGQRVVRGRER